MKILWICNVATPEVDVLLGKKINPFGGWLVNYSDKISENVELFYAFPDKNVEKVEAIKGKKINYYRFPYIDDFEDENKLSKYALEIIKEVNPKCMHIFGTEHIHSLVFLNCFDTEKTVIHIQGLISIFEKHYLSNLLPSIATTFTLRDLIKNDSLINQQLKMRKRGEKEIEILKKCKFVVGRTEWDYACIKQINEDITYYRCNEMLRSMFYDFKWEYKKCEKHSIFVSQGNYPLKGLHNVLNAFAIVLKKYPDSLLYISGHNNFKDTSFKGMVKQSAYTKYIKSIIKNLALENNIKFTGVLDEQEMCKRYLKSNVFVSAASIENSPNSLGEAMLIGTPCISSFVGGVPSLFHHEVDGYSYPSDAYYMLAHYILKIFEDENRAGIFSSNSRMHAMETHNVNDIIRNTIDIYNKIISGN